MKYLKKITALVVVMAMYCTMAGTTSAQAAPPTTGAVIFCNHDLEKKGIIREYWYESEQEIHKHIESNYYDYERKAWVTVSVYPCVITTIYQVYETRCYCGKNKGQYTETVAHHSATDGN